MIIFNLYKNNTYQNPTNIWKYYVFPFGHLETKNYFVIVFLGNIFYRIMNHVIMQLVHRLLLKYKLMAST